MKPTLFLTAALAAPALAAPIASPDDKIAARQYASYGTYSGAGAGTTYTTYGSYSGAGSGGTGSGGKYSSYGTYPKPAGGYGSYGKYSRALDWVKSLFG